MIGFQGIKGCYSEQALNEFLKKEKIFYSNSKVPQGIGFNLFEDIYKNIISNKIYAGFIPIENSLGGTIHENYDLLKKYDVKIRNEFNFKIKHSLMCVKGADIQNIKKVTSHYQALSQCKNNCEKMNLQLIEMFDTAGSAKYIKEENKIDTFCIASSINAKIYDLNIVKEDFNDNNKCYTRFLYIIKNNKNNDNSILDYHFIRNNILTKTSIVISLTDSAGVLFKILSIFNLNDINLTKIESRPNRKNNEIDINKPFEYLFYLDFIGKKENIEKTINILSNYVDNLKILGNYLSDNIINS